MNSTGKNSMYYTHTDYLGSYQTITNELGNVVEELSFDSCPPVRNEMKAGLPDRNEMEAGGRRRNPQDWTYNNVPTSYIFDRGYTGHQQMDVYGLINMPARRNVSEGGNGRLYDPRLGRMLSPDPFVQAPTYSQNFNRYSYALNNPLKYTDPSGEFLLTWSLNNSGFSIGLNFTPAYPVGFGLNFGWADGFSVGVYGEVGPRFGGTGLGTGFTVSQSLDYNFKHNNWSTTTSEGAYVSLGPFNAGFNISSTYDISNKKFSGTNWGVSAGIGIIGKERGGVGLYVGYGSGGLSYGIGGYYNSRATVRNTLSEINKYTIKMPELEGFDVSMFRSELKPFYLNSELYFDGQALYVIDNYSNDQQSLRATYQAVSGPWGNGRLPNGTYTASNLRTRTNLRMFRDGVGFSLDLNDIWDSNLNIERTLLRIHPDGSADGRWWLNNGTSGCIGIQSNAAGLTNFYNFIGTYLSRNSGTIKLIVNY